MHAYCHTHTTLTHTHTHTHTLSLYSLCQTQDFIVLQLQYIFEVLKDRQCSLPPAMGGNAGRPFSARCSEGVIHCSKSEGIMRPFYTLCVMLYALCFNFFVYFLCLISLLGSVCLFYISYCGLRVVRLDRLRIHY